MFPMYINVPLVCCFSGITDTTKRGKCSWKLGNHSVDVFPLFKEGNNESSLDNHCSLDSDLLVCCEQSVVRNQGVRHTFLCSGRCIAESGGKEGT